MPARGFLMIEILIGAAIAAVSLVALAGTMAKLAAVSNDNLYRTQAGFLAEEGLEVARHLRDRGWSANLAPLSPDIDYYLIWQDGWQFSTASPGLIDGRFDRRLRLATAYRDVNNDLAPAGALEPNARLVRVTVAWRGGAATTSRELAAYLTNMFNH